MVSALTLSHLSKRYGSHQALDDLSLCIQPGEIYCLLGHNGAGKSTTVHLILNFLTPDSGEIQVGGRALAYDPQAALQSVAYIPENVQLYRELDAREHLRLFLRLAGQRASRARIDELLSRVGLPDFAWRRALGKLSKGMRQKVAIAIALAKESQLLVLDEPTSGLDPEASYLFAQQLQALSREGVGIFMVTHDLFRVRELGARVGILHRGVLRQELEAAQLSASELEAVYLRQTGSQTGSQKGPQGENHAS